MEAPFTLEAEDIGVTDGYSPELLEHAQNIAKSLPDPSRPLLTDAVSVDPFGCRDRDDAVSVVRDGRGWDVAVHVPDVRSVVTPDDPLYREAVRRVETRYHGKTNDPMFPHVLSEGALSLFADVERSTITVRARVNSALTVTAASIELTRLRSPQAFTYEEAGTILSGRRNSPYGVLLRHADDLAGALRRRRKGKGGLFFERAHALEQAELSADEDGNLRMLRASEAKAHHLIEELMIFANGVVADWARRTGVPFLYRKHVAKSSSEEVHRRYAEHAKLALDGHLSVQDVRRRMAMIIGRAEYDTEFPGHFGLARGPEEPYAHFTSPIRRLSDTLNQTNVAAAISGRPVPFSLEQMKEFGEYINAKTVAIRRASPRRDEGKGKTGKAAFNDELILVNTGTLPDVSSFSVSTLNELMPQFCVMDITEEWADGLFTAIAKDEMSSIAPFFKILTGSTPDHPVWSALRRRIALHIVQFPKQAKAVLHHISESMPQWASVRYDTKKVPQGYASRVMICESGQDVTTSVAPIASSKKEAETLASAEFIAEYFANPDLLVRQDMTVSPADLEPLQQHLVAGEYRNALELWARARGTQLVFDVLGSAGPSHATLFTVRCTAGTVVEEASDTSLKKAKSRAAAAVLHSVGLLAALPPQAPVIVPPPLPRRDLRQPMASDLKFKNFKGALQIVTAAEGWAPASYELVEQTGPSHKPAITVRCVTSHGEECATAGRRADAERQAARKMLQRLGYLPKENS